jgi:hypothetical protein
LGQVATNPASTSQRFPAALQVLHRHPPTGGLVFPHLWGRWSPGPVAVAASTSPALLVATVETAAGLEVAEVAVARATTALRPALVAAVQMDAWW